MSFEERFETMGLSNMGNECYHYSDRYGEVVYRKLETKGGSGIADDFSVPYLALFTKNENNNEFQYCGIVSDSYKFVGNDVINSQIRESIREVGVPILREKCFITPRLTHMYNEIIIEHATNVVEQGDIYPQIIIKNSYDGTGATNIAFGICMQDSYGRDIGFGFREKISNMNQIHITNSETTLSAAVGGYITAFSENIVELIQSSFNNHLTEDEVLSTLDLVEKVGKKRRDAVSSILEELNENQGTNGIQSWEMSAFNLFLAITRFSSLEKNLNAKVMLESIAERCLTVPSQMTDMMKVLNESTGQAL